MLTLLETVIAVIVVYLTFSIVVFGIVEGIATLLQLRGKTLRKAVYKILEDWPCNDKQPLDKHSGFAHEVYTHPQVQSLQRADNKLTSYIPAKHISAAIIDLVANRVPAPGMSPSPSMTDSPAPAGEEQAATHPGKELYQRFRIGLEQLEGKSLKTLLSSLAQQTSNLHELQTAIQTWFDNCMDRSTGWYKRKVKLIVVIVAIVVTTVFNVDTLYIIEAARTDVTLRRELNSLADKMIGDTTVAQLASSLQQPDSEFFNDYENDSSVATVPAAEETIQPPSAASNAEHPSVMKRREQFKYFGNLISETAFPVGWTGNHRKFTWWMLAGWALSVIALSAGAPFWFDVLKKMVNLRTSGPKPTATSDKAN